MALRVSARHELWRRVGGRRIVGPVDLGMAVQATATLPQVDHVLATGKTIADWHAGLTANGADAASHVGRVTLLAKHRRACLEHAGDDAAVRVVAVGAVFCDWIMLVHERAAFFGMAGVAGVVRAVAFDQLGSDRAMRIVAIGADHLAFGNRVVGRTIDLRALFLVAGVADFCLRRAVADLVIVAVDFVTGIAGHIGIVMRAAIPMRAIRVFDVAVHADCAAFIGRQCELPDEHAIRVVVGRFLGVLEAGAMAADAVGNPRVAGKAMCGLAHVGQVFFVMAGDAQLGTDLAGGPGRPHRTEQTEQAQAQYGH